MPSPSITIAIDGYSSTGKSSFAKMVARKYGLLYLDSGALYRAVTLYAMEGGFINDGKLDMDTLAPFLGDLNIHFRTAADGSSQTCIGERNVEEDIRTMAVSQNVSAVSAAPLVRRYVDTILHRCAEGGGVIMDGRDIGTTVLPGADLKIFMTADPQVRARRRALELRAKGQECDEAQVLENLRQRDYLDSHREVSPLTRAEDAIDLDNTDMSFEDQMAWIGEILQQRFGLAAVRQ